MIDFCLKCVYALVSTLSFQDTDETSNGFFVSLVRDVKLQNCWLVKLLEILTCKNPSDFGCYMY